MHLDGDGGPSLTLDPFDNTILRAFLFLLPLSRAHLSCDNRSCPRHHLIEKLPKEHIESLRTAGINVCNFAYEPMFESSKAPEVFDLVPLLISVSWQMRNREPEENYGPLSPKNKMGRLSPTELAPTRVRCALAVQ